MKTVLRFLLYTIGIIVFAALCFIGFLEWRGIPKYEVEKIDFPQVPFDSAMLTNGMKIAAVQCMFCHMGSDGKLSGKLIKELPPEFGEIHSANITQSKEHGIGKWTDDQLAYLLRTGCQPDGQYIPDYMPKFVHMSDYDLKSIIVFLHSGTPVVQASEIPRVASKPFLLTKFLALVKFKKKPYPKGPIEQVDTNNLVAYGHYLVTGRYDCYPCHSKDFKTMDQEFPEKSEGFMGGGNPLFTMDGKIRYTANITMDEETGIGKWCETDFANVMLHCKNKDGHIIREPMLPYNGMTDHEIKAIWAYLLTVPKITNKVDRKWEQD